jgi:hypothetical protein
MAEQKVPKATIHRVSSTLAPFVPPPDDEEEEPIDDPS